MFPVRMEKEITEGNAMDKEITSYTTGYGVYPNHWPLAEAYRSREK